MKKIAGLVVILAVIILGGYYVTGYITERTVKDAIKNINQVQGLHAEIEQYNRGWFTSAVRIDWNLQVPERVVKGNDGQLTTVPAQNFKMDMPLKIYHGPVMFAPTGVHFGLGYAHTQLNLPSPYAEQFDAMFTEKSTRPRQNLSLLVTYLNNLEVNGAVPQFTLYAKQGNGKFEWLGMKSTTSMTSDMDKIDGVLDIAGFRLVKDQTKVNMGTFSAEYDLYRSAMGLMLGKVGINLASFIVNAPNDVFEIAGVKVLSKSDIDEGLLHSNFQASLDKIVVNGEIFGPGHVEISLKNLDADALAKINAQAASMKNDTDAQQRQALFAMLPELPALFSKGAVLEISPLTFTMPKGVIEGHLHISVPESGNKDALKMFKSVKGKGKLSIPVTVLKTILIGLTKERLAQQPDIQQVLVEQMKKVTQPDQSEATAQPAPSLEQMAVKQVNQSLSQMTQSGLLVKQDSYYVIEFKLEEGKLTVNGQPFDPSMMIF